jgi:hypothetical protein
VGWSTGAFVSYPSSPVSTLIRSFWFAAATVLYVAFASLQADPRGLDAWLVLVVAPVVLWLTWRYTGTLARLEERDRDVRRDCVRAAATGALIFVAARTGPLGHPGFDAAANLGVGITLVAANIALSRIQSRGGLQTAPPTTRSLDSAIFAALLWGIAAALPTLRSVVSRSLLLLDPVAIDYATVTAGMASLLLMLAVTLRLRVLRRLELDVADRAVSALTVASVALLATLPALLLDIVAPDRAVPAVLIVSGLFHVWAAGTNDARRVTSSLRALLAISAFLSPVVLSLAIVSRRSPLLAPSLIVAAAAVSVLVGLLAARLSRPLGPEQSRWLDAIDKASEAALVPDPDDALRATLVALGPIAPGPSSRVELWRLQPESTLYVDIAGQLHDEAAQIPSSTIELSAEEPERTLRLDVLRAAQVRNPKAREALCYFENRHIYAATLLTSESGPLGLLALPESHRKTPLSLEETVAIRRLGDRLESVLAITSAQARSRQRELEALAKVTELVAETRRLAQALESDGARQRRFAERYVRRLQPTVYSPSARTAQLTLERFAKSAREISIVLPPGTDALSWSSLVHLASPRHDGPFVVFDAISSDFDPESWQDPEHSPLGVAETGTCVLLDPQALETAQLGLLVQALHVHRAIHGFAAAPAMGLVLAWHRSCQHADVALDPSDQLLQLFPLETRVVIPSLADRAEDLRALVYERVARLGAMIHGKPLGVEPSALAVLIEHDWPLNDLELDTTLHALVLATRGDAVTTEVLDQIGFGSPSAELQLAPPSGPKRRPRSTARSIHPRDR